MQNNRDSNAPVLSERHEDADLHTRVRAEFQEMPGLKLTCRRRHGSSTSNARDVSAFWALVDGGALSCDGGHTAGGRRPPVDVDGTRREMCHWSLERIVNELDP